MDLKITEEKLPGEVLNQLDKMRQAAKEKQQKRADEEILKLRKQDETQVKRVRKEAIVRAINQGLVSLKPQDKVMRVTSTGCVDDPTGWGTIPIRTVTPRIISDIVFKTSVKDNELILGFVHLQGDSADQSIVFRTFEPGKEGLYPILGDWGTTLSLIKELHPETVYLQRW